MVANVDKRNENGFTLLELIIVLAIVLIVMQVLFISVGYFQEDRKEETVEYMNNSVHEALVSYYATFGDFDINTAEVPVGYANNDVSEAIANQFIINLQRATAINIGKEYNHKTYKMSVRYINKYVMKIEFKLR